MDHIDLTNELRADLIDYLVRIDERITSPNTIKSYLNILNRVFKNFKVLDRQTTREMLKRWNKTTKIRAVLSKINEYFDYQDIDYLIKLPKNKRKERHIPEIITREELTKKMETMPKEAKLIISCIFNIGAGLRISELINLKWGDLSWEEWSEECKTLNVKIRNSKRNKDRIVPIPSFTAAELYKYAEEIGAINEEGIPTGDYIFDFGSDSFKKELKLLEPEQWKHEYTLHSYDFVRHNIINKFFNLNTNRKITAHCLRHSRATELYDKYKVPIVTIQKWLGHSDISTTMIYVHLSSKEDKELMERVGGI